MEKNVSTILEKVNNITDSQKDRIDSQSLIQTELIGFLNNQIQKVSEKNNLRELVIKVLKDRIADEDDAMSTTQLLRLFEILSKDENDSISNILGVIKDKNTVVQFNNTETRRDSNFSAEEIERAKKFLNAFDIMKEIKKSEMSIEEIENKD